MRVAALLHAAARKGGAGGAGGCRRRLALGEADACGGSSTGDGAAHSALKGSGARAPEERHKVALLAGTVFGSLAAFRSRRQRASIDTKPSARAREMLGCRLAPRGGAALVTKVSRVHVLRSVKQRAPSRAMASSIFSDVAQAPPDPILVRCGLVGAFATPGSLPARLARL